MAKNQGKIWGFLAIGITGATVIYGLFLVFAPTEHLRFISPDKRHTLIVYRYPRLYAMPGQGSDAPGFVTLIDRNGKELARRELEMVQLVHNPEWLENRVRVRVIFDWPR